jgi:tetratricopeptide (TPR) repeat protein
MAMEHHQAGRLDLAAMLYEKILTDDPDQADALHLLGVVAQERGVPARAVELIERAIALNPDNAAYHTNLGEIHRAGGNLHKACEHFRTALRLDPQSAEALNNLGLALAQQGQEEEGARLLEAAIALKPFAATPYINLGNVLRGQGRLREALAISREGVRLIPQVPALHGALGRVLVDVDRPGEAVAYWQEAVRLEPNGDRLYNLAKALHLLGRNDEAQACCRQAIQADAALPAAHHLLGRIVLEMGQPGEAIACFRQALALDPYSLEIHFDLGRALYDNEQVDDAIAEHRLVTKLYPQHAEAFNSLGYLFQDQGDITRAIGAYHDAIRVKPDYADAHLNLGLALIEAGEMETALGALRRALRVDPSHAEAYAALALTLRDKLPEDDLAAIRHLLTGEKVTGKKRAVLQFGLAQALDARSRFAEAAEQVRQANAYFKEEEQRRGRGFDPVEHQAYVAQILAAFTDSHFEHVRGWGLESDLPVFILGLPRSGTSLIEQILASHPRMFGAGELNLIRDCYRAIPGLVGKNAPGVECIGDLTPQVVQELAQRYLTGLRRLDAGAMRILDKMPDNYLMLGLIATLLPRARIIHTRRDLRDVALSCWMTYFRHIRWSFDMDHIGVRIREYVRLMEHWRKVLPLPMLEVTYEETVADLEGVARKLVAWCGLEWHPACLNFHKTQRPVRTASMIQVREPVYSRSVGRWKQYREVLLPFEKYVDHS